MEINSHMLQIILGAAIVTLLPRVLPLVVFSRMALPHWALRLLGHVPVAVMSALLAQALLTQDDRLVPLWTNARLLALLPTLAVAVLTRSLLGTVLAGVLSLLALNLLL